MGEKGLLIGLHSPTTLVRENVPSYTSQVERRSSIDKPQKEEQQQQQKCKVSLQQVGR